MRNAVITLVLLLKMPVLNLQESFYLDIQIMHHNIPFVPDETEVVELLGLNSHTFNNHCFHKLTYQYMYI
jgi:hypothetical protein